MKASNNRKTSSREQEILNPGPASNARTYRISNPSGVENKSIPRGRGSTSSDQAETEKQNQ
jgi:hypothetical protein